RCLFCQFAFANNPKRCLFAQFAFANGGNPALFKIPYLSENKKLYKLRQSSGKTNRWCNSTAYMFQFMRKLFQVQKT
ncbi:MAG: hypothetical protein MJ159_07495, partial [Treponemataceae bacterium]|nr:hypothetical protein [Treponemataceae bacterium]